MTRPISALALCALLSCTSESQVQCGFGTLAVEGRCEIEPISALDCGAGTHLDAERGLCLRDEPAVSCGSDTLNQDGICTCPHAADCAASIPCPLPSASGTATLCGRFLDAETLSPIATADAAGAICDPDAPSPNGPCALDVHLFDALALAAAPDTTTELPVEHLVVDQCGRFRAIDVSPPFHKHVAIVVSSPDRVPTIAVVQTSEGERLTSLLAFSTRATTDQAWTTTAGSPFGADTFADIGAVALRFLRDDLPAPDVQVDTAYYFADTDSATLSTIAPAATTTGPNGAALIVEQPLGQLEPTGGLPPNCEWQIPLTATIPGHIMFILPTAFCG